MPLVAQLVLACQHRWTGLVDRLEMGPMSHRDDNEYGFVGAMLAVLLLGFIALGYFMLHLVFGELKYSLLNETKLTLHLLSSPLFSSLKLFSRKLN